MKSRIVLAFCLMLSPAIAASADDAADQSSPDQTFLANLQKALRTNDANWLADHVHYPASYYGVKSGSKGTKIQNKAWFISHYPQLIGPKLRAVVLAQDPDQLFHNYQGIMIGSDPNIWFNNFGDGPDNIRYEIITINDAE
jgi:hypothetical protein